MTVPELPSTSPKVLTLQDELKQLKRVAGLLHLKPANVKECEKELREKYAKKANGSEAKSKMVPPKREIKTFAINRKKKK